MRDPTMAAATLVGAQADAMKAAAENKSGAMTGFVGMGMAMNAGGGMNAQNLFAMGQQNQQAQQQAAAAPPPSANWLEMRLRCGRSPGTSARNCGAKKPEPKPEAGAWRCKCGATVTGKFCPECGSPRPADSDGWTCACGTVNKGRFCQNCGAKKPADAAPLPLRQVRLGAGGPDESPEVLPGVRRQVRRQRHKINPPG